MARELGGTPWYRGPDRRDGFAAAVALGSAYALDWQAVAEAIGYVDTFQLADEILSTEVYPPGAYFRGERFVVIVLAGITAPTEIIAAVTTTNQIEMVGVTGKVAQNWGALAAGLWVRWGSQISTDTASRKLVLLGHSLGGAVVTVLSALFRHHFPARDCVVHSFGTPRPGDAVFADSVGDNVVRWVDEGDPIPDIPPALWNGVGSAFPVSGAPPLAVWAQPDIGWTITEDGAIETGTTPLGLAAAAVKIVSNDLSSHYIQTYATRLKSRLTDAELVAPAASYVAGYFIPQRYDFLTFQEGVAMADFSQLVFSFSASVARGAVGWEETWWTEKTTADGNGPAMYDLAKKRAAFLYGGAVINTVSLRLFPSSRIVATYVVNQQGHTEAVNDWNNCAVYKGISANGKNRLVHMHGIFDEAVTNQALSGTGAATIGNYAPTFLLALRQFTAGIRYRSKTLTVPIQSATVNATAGTLTFTVTTTAGYAVGDTILVSRYQPAPLLNGIWVLKGIDSTTLTVAMGTRTLGPGNVAPSGTISKLSYAVSAFSGFQGPTFGEKKIGRPPLPYRGRTKKKVFHS